MVSIYKRKTGERSDDNFFILLIFTKSINSAVIFAKISTMKKFLLLVILAIVGVGAWFYWQSKPKPDNELAPLQEQIISKHTDAFNTSFDSLLNNYYQLTEAFVRWDSNAILQHTTSLNTQVQQLKMEEMAKDTMSFEAALTYKTELSNNLNAIEQEKDLTAKRRNFHTLSQNLYDLLRIVKHDASKVYLQECPMAFNDTETGLWLSKSSDIRNPYLGLHHPKYKSGMLECGEVKDSLTNK